MLIPHVVQTEADKVFVNILNNQASALSDGDTVAWNTSSPDGVRTTQPATATFSLLVGLAEGTIAASAYGLAQAYGYKSAASVTNTTNTAIVAGDILVPVTATDYLTRSAAGNGTISGGGFVYAAAAVSTATTPGIVTAGGVFLRAL
jgi:hypothetical protein